MAWRVTIAVLCLVLVIQIWAKEPRPCCWIYQMTGKSELQMTTELEDGTVVLETVDSEFAYDKTFNSKAFIFTETFENGTKRVGRVVEFYDYGISFYIEDNQGEQTCYRTRIPFQFRPACIPEDASYQGNLTFGDNALTGHVWEVNRDGGGYVANATFLYAADYCVPITINYVIQDFNQSPPGGEVASITYGDIELGICDRKKYFKIPDFCPQDGVTRFGQKVMQRLQMLNKGFNML